MSFYETYILPKFLDCVCSQEGFQNKRAQIFPYASGEVLEIGVGTGLNFKFYDFDKVISVKGIDPSTSSLEIAKRRIIEMNIPVEVMEGSAEEITFQDNTFDSVVVGYSLCTIPDPIKALKEIKRVLKSNGKLFFTEHGISPEESVRRWQHRINPIWSKLAGGCNINRNTEDMILRSGFKFDQLQKKYIKGPKIACFNYYGIAGKS
jgi:ubiquinone/menaquinone biosynthesis C-methylase UbiE